MNEQAAIWMDYAERDIKLAEKLQNEEYFAGAAVFHSEQAVEKALKALLLENGCAVERTHSLIKLYGRLPENIRQCVEISEEDLLPIEEVYIDSRYPSIAGLLPSGVPTSQDAQLIFQLAEKIFVSVKAQLLR